MAEITDPGLLNVLNAPTKKKSGEITDPDLLAHLNATENVADGPQANGDNTGVGPRHHSTNGFTQGVSAMIANPAAAGRAVLQGATMDLSDEAEAAVRALSDRVPQNATAPRGNASAVLPQQTDTRPFSEKYREQKNTIDARTEADKKELGHGYDALEFGGGMIVPGMGAAKAATRLAPAGASLLRRSLVNGAVSGVTGGVQSYGAQQGEGDVGKALKDGLETGAIFTAGTPVWALARQAARGGGKVATWARDKVESTLEDRALKRHQLTNPTAPLPISPSARAGAVRKTVDALEEGGVGAQQYQAQARGAALPNEQDVAPAVASPVLREMGKQQLKDLPSETFGGRGNITDTYRGQSLETPNGVTQADALRGRVVSHQPGMAFDPATRVGIFNAQRDLNSAVINNIVTNGGNVRVPNAQHMADTYEWWRRDYLEALNTHGIPPVYYAQRAGANTPPRLRIPDNYMPARVAHSLRSKWSGNTQLDAGAAKDRAMIGFNEMENAAASQGAASPLRQLSQANRNAATAHTAEENLNIGGKFAERGVTQDAAALADRRTSNMAEQREQTAGTLYKLSGDIDEAASATDGAGSKLNKVAGDYFGSNSKIGRFTEWVAQNGRSDHAFVAGVERDLRQIGMRHEVADELHELLTRGTTDKKDQMRSFARFVRNMMFSSKTGGLAATLQNMTHGMSTMRKYEVARLIYDKTALGEQAILQEFARRSAARGAAGRVNPALGRKAIINELARQFASSGN